MLDVPKKQLKECKRPGDGCGVIMGVLLTYFHVVGVCFFSVSLEQIKNLHKRFQQLSGNEETIR